GLAAGPELAFARFKPDGKLDTSFGQGGIQYIPVRSGTSFGGGVTIVAGADGSALAGYDEINGSVTNIIIIKVDTSGQLVQAFGGAGRAALTLPMPELRLLGLAVRANGAIFGVVEGTYGEGAVLNGG